MTTIVLADDHQIVRRGLKSALETEPEFRVVGGKRAAATKPSNWWRNSGRMFWSATS